MEKSRTGAETVREWVTAGERFPIALLGRTPADVRDVMIEGESGLLNVFPPNQKPLYEPSKRRVTFHTGIHATVYSSENPEQLRGPQESKAWTDELGSFKTREAWDNLQLGLRLGTPKQIVTTTPRPISTIRELVKDAEEEGWTTVTRGTTYENRSNLAPAFFRQVIRRYEGTTPRAAGTYGVALRGCSGRPLVPVDYQIRRGSPDHAACHSGR